MPCAFAVLLLCPATRITRSKGTSTAPGQPVRRPTAGAARSRWGCAGVVSRYGARSPRVGVLRGAAATLTDANRPASGQRERHVTQCQSMLNRSKIQAITKMLSRDCECAAHALKPRCGTKLSRVPSPGLAPGR